MMGTVYLLLGALLLLLVIYDFFFTTLSGTGAGFITRSISFPASGLLRLIGKNFSRRIFSFSGMLANLTVLVVWIILVWLGLFLLFSSQPEGIITDSGKTANAVERLYYSGYTLSTLGMGDIKPTTSFFKFLTSSLSFFGFIFFTTSMTYLISVSSAVIDKRSLALTIYNLGENPNAIVSTLLKVNLSYCYQQLLFLQEMIDRQTVNHQAYPVLHLYSNPSLDSSLSINLARLDEAISIILNSHKGKKLKIELKPLRISLTRFLQHLNYNVKGKIYNHSSAESDGTKDIDQLYHRRKILTALLKNEGFNWDEVYST